MRTVEIAPWRWRIPASLQVSPIFWIAFGSVVSFVLTYRLFFLPMVSDEGGYAYAAERWFDGRGSLYGDIWISRPQAIFVVYGVINRVLGGSTVDFRITAWLINVLTMIVVWLLASRWQGPKVAAGATMIFALLMGSPAIEGFTANAEIFMALPAALSMCTLLRAFSTRWSWFWLFATGALVSIATQLKPSGIVMIAVVLGFVAIMLIDSDGFLRSITRCATFLSLGFAAALTPALYHGYKLGWDEFVYASVGYRLTRQSSATSSIYHHAHALWDLTARIWPLYVVLVLVVLIRYATKPDRKHGNVSRPSGAFRPHPAYGIVSLPSVFEKQDPVRRLMQLWIIGCAFGISMGGDWWYHYLIQIAAPFAIWVAVSVAELRPRVSRNMHVALVTGVVAMLLVPYLVIAEPSRAAMSSKLFGHPGYADQEAVARYLNEHTYAETPIFVAFDQAALYYLADRPSTYRYLYDQELRALPDSEDALVAMVESPDRPEYIVGTRQLAPFEDRGLAFWEAVQRHYVLETVVRGVPIYRAIPEMLDPVSP